MKQNSYYLLFLFLFIKITPLYSITPDCEILKYITRCEVKESKLIQLDTIVIQINNRNGESYSGLSIPYSKLIKVLDIDGWIEDSNGKIVRRLRNSDITDRNEVSDYAFYEDNFEKAFSLKHNTYPYKIFFTYKVIKNQYISIVDWSPVIYSRISTRNATLTLLLPKDCQVRKFVRGATIIEYDSTNINFTRIVYSSNYDKVNYDQLFSEPFENSKPRVTIIPKEFFYGIKGKTENWIEYGNWFLNLNKGLLDLPQSEKMLIDGLIMNINDPKEKAKILYYYLQDHTRYINVSIGIGGFKSYPASYVSQNKYGDCKALTNYMMALLNYVGIKSYYTLINSSLQPENLIEDLPYPQFNHIILTVPFEKDTIWIENTSTSEPFGYVCATIQNRKALFIDENRSKLIKIPVTNSSQISVIRKIKLVINRYGNGDCQTNFTFGGFNFEQYNQLNTFYTKKEQDDIIKELVPFQSYDLLSWDLKKFKRDSAGIRLDSRLNIYKFFKPLGSEVYFNLNPILRYSFERPTDRKFNLQIPYPINNIDTTIYQIPEEFVLKRIPEDIRVTTQFGNCELSTKKAGNSIYVIKKLLIYPIFYNLNQYKGFYEFIKSVNEIDRNVIVLTGSTAN